jgi:hypothetical protein
MPPAPNCIFSSDILGKEDRDAVPLSASVGSRREKDLIAKVAGGVVVERLRTESDAL